MIIHPPSPPLTSAKAPALPSKVMFVPLSWAPPPNIVPSVCATVAVVEHGRRETVAAVGPTRPAIQAHVKSAVVHVIDEAGPGGGHEQAMVVGMRIVGIATFGIPARDASPWSFRHSWLGEGRRRRRARDSGLVGCTAIVLP